MMTTLLSIKKTAWIWCVRLIRSPRCIVILGLFWISSLALLLLSKAGSVSAQTGTPPSSTISTTSGPVAWDFAAVVGGTVMNVGIQDTCPPGMCDDHDLTFVLPTPAATFYQTSTVQLTIKYTWTSTVPTDLHIFAISPNGADHGPGSPGDTSTGPGEEDLTVTDPVDGVWHIRSVASLAPMPTSAHAMVTVAVAPRPTAPPAELLGERRKRRKGDDRAMFG